jgi:hypothetical protein
MNISPILRSIVTVRSAIPQDAFTAIWVPTGRAAVWSFEKVGQPTAAAFSENRNYNEFSLRVGLEIEALASRKTGRPRSE